MSVHLTRRNFLTYLLVSTAAATFTPKLGFANYSPNNQPVSNWLSFSTQNGVGPWQDESTVMERCCALHKETILPRNRVEKSDYRNTILLLEKVLANEGIHRGESRRVVWTYQHYGVCDSSIHSKRLLLYSRLAQDYLYSNISGLVDFNHDWSVLENNHSQSLVDLRGYRGFVGKHTYLVYRVNAIDENGRDIQPGIVNVIPVERAINYIVDDDNHIPTRSTIFVIHGLTSLNSPFSELIHLTTHQPTLRLIRELAVSQGESYALMLGRAYGEAVTEAAGILIALNFLQKYGSVDEENVVRSVSKNISSQYSLAKSAMTFMSQNGVQRVLNAYSENPLLVINQITKKIAVL